MTPLRGVGVLVTRPEHQAAPLCGLLESAGAVVVRLAAIELEPAQDLQALRDRLGSIADFDLVVFTSANAVHFGAALLAGSRHPFLAAIGPATARALEAAGQRVTLMPVAGYDSEGLLRHPTLARVQGRRVLLVKGLQGRELLQDQLAQRGAHVTVAEVYRRVRARHDGAALAAVEAQFAAGAIHVMTATSAQIAASLVEMATPALRREFAQVHWLAPGARVAAAVRALGVTAPILQADSAEDHDLVAAIVRWRGGVGGA